MKVYEAGRGWLSVQMSGCSVNDISPLLCWLFYHPHFRYFCKNY